MRLYGRQHGPGHIVEVSSQNSIREKRIQKEKCKKSV